MQYTQIGEISSIEPGGMEQSTTPGVESPKELQPLLLSTACTIETTDSSIFEQLRAGQQPVFEIQGKLFTGDLMIDRVDGEILCTFSNIREVQ